MCVSQYVHACSRDILPKCMMPTNHALNTMTAGGYGGQSVLHHGRQAQKVGTGNQYYLHCVTISQQSPEPRIVPSAGEQVNKRVRYILDSNSSVLPVFQLSLLNKNNKN